MEKKHISMVLFALALMLLLPGMAAEAKSKPTLAERNKTTAAGQKYRLQLKGVSGKAKVKWKTSKKSVVSIAKRRGNTVIFKTVKKGKAVITATYKKKKYRCRINVRSGKKVGSG